MPTHDLVGVAVLSPEARDVRQWAMDDGPPGGRSDQLLVKVHGVEALGDYSGYARLWLFSASIRPYIVREEVMEGQPFMVAFFPGEARRKRASR